MAILGPAYTLGVTIPWSYAIGAILGSAYTLGVTLSWSVCHRGHPTVVYLFVPDC